MRVLVIVPGDKNSEAGQMPSQELIEKMRKFNEELAGHRLTRVSSCF
jgi:hypothetical protein